MYGINLDVPHRVWYAHYLFKTAGPGYAAGCVSDWQSGGRGPDALVRHHSFVEIDYELLSMVILSLADSRRAVVSYWR